MSFINGKNTLYLNYTIFVYFTLSHKFTAKFELQPAYIVMTRFIYSIDSIEQHSAPVVR